MRRSGDAIRTALGGCALLVAAAQPAVVQAAGQPVIVTTPAQTGSAGNQPPRDPNQIEGIRIEDNDALITGPINQRRVYIPLDKPVMPAGFRTAWVAKLDSCAAARVALSHPAATLPADTLLITDTQMIARKTWSILQVYVPLPESFTMAMLDSGRPLVLPASKYRGAGKVLVIYAESDGHRGYMELTQLDKGAKLDMSNNRSRETGLRCDK
ncbi:hypothetical protein [Novosphingobium barchaimii]|uniref:hypothetical protein n=1 Tax=Novosphingobium barchaimii TaxID=1420591 RepID=UPI000741280C|nr:hypothetical protein [Novosphingobium barchaimii]